MPERLRTRLDGIWDCRLGLIVAPPGSGKSTLMAAFARDLRVPVAWYQADRWDTAETSLLLRLARAFAAVTDGASMAWSDPDEAIDGIGAIGSDRVLLVLDDVQALEGSPAEGLIERLLAHGPACLTILAASRSQPRLNLSRYRLSGELLEITAADLRFRTWEVERLFRDFYREPLPPVELARLARWTEGWAAGLQLFHLATTGRPPDERRRVLRSLGPHSRLAREYLAQNVLERVRDEIRQFLLRTSVLGRLNGPLCDRLLGREGSEAVLEELERGCLFTTPLEEAGSYRYHEVFRSFLQGVLVAEVGEERVRASLREAGDLLMTHGSPDEALEAYVRAEAWDMVERLLGTEGRAIAEGPLRWLSVEGQQSLREDAWLGLAGARRLRAEGHFPEALTAYGMVARETRTPAAAEMARRERSALLTWFAPDSIGRQDPPGAWWSLLRRALHRDATLDLHAPVADGQPPDGRLVAGVGLLLAGELHDGRTELTALAEHNEAEGLVACIAQLARGAAALLADEAEGIADINGAIGAAEGLGWEWLARVGRSLLALSGRPHHLGEASRLVETAHSFGDGWGAAIASLAVGWGGVVAAGRHPHLELSGVDALASACAAAREFRTLGAPVMWAWAEAVSALAAAMTGRDSTLRHAARARAAARSLRLPACDLIADMAEACWSRDERTCRRLADHLVRSHGLELRPWAHAAEAPAVEPHLQDGRDAAPGAPASLRLLGEARFAVGGEEIDLRAIRPRVRTLFYLLALNVDRPVHREVLSETLWPGTHPAAQARNLHVAIASLRRVLEPHASRRSFRFVLRDGESYLLELPPGSTVDVLGFEHAVSQVRQASGRRDGSAVERWGRIALERYRGELLPEAGPAEWVVARRDALRGLAVHVAELLAGTLLEAGDPVAAAAVCSTGLRHDPYHDPLWRALIRAREAAGDPAAARSARSDYRRVLQELDIDAKVVASPH